MADDRKAAQEVAKKANRLPPGQSLTLKFPVLHVDEPKAIDLESWRFRIFGEVEEELVWTWEEFNRLPRTKITIDLHCVTQWTKLDTLWEGVSLRQLVDDGIVKPKPTARYVIQHCAEEYTTNTTLAQALLPNMLMATHYDGKPLEFEHGYPLRMVIGDFADKSQEQSAYLWKGGKWLEELEITAHDCLGFWEKEGYHNQADPWKEQRFA